MAGYGTARSLAKRLGRQEIADVLQKTLDKERAADEKLSELAQNEVNVHAASAEH
jgi:ferritin-like metal-binding protein YciE